MRFPATSRWFLSVLCMAALPAASGQRAGAKVSTQAVRGVAQGSAVRGAVVRGARARLLTRAEGRTIARVAMNSRHHLTSRYDCSHFVHGLYEKAGFRYEYAPSTQLYEGVPEFRRVSTPQAGDLAVWPGHAGIVINPARHSFLSVLHTGPGVDRYDSRYWRGRGQPRFLRYLLPKEADAASAVTIVRPRHTA